MLSKLFFLSIVLTLYFLAATLLRSSSIHRLIFTLIVFFVNLFIFFIYVGAEFIAFAFLVIYIGAIAILFVFTVMAVQSGTTLAVKPHPLSVVGFVILFVHLALSLIADLSSRVEYSSLALSYIGTSEMAWSGAERILFQIYDILLFGSVVYTNYRFFFWISGLLLLVAIIGVIALSVPSRTIERTRTDLAKKGSL